MINFFLSSNKMNLFSKYVDDMMLVEAIKKNFSASQNMKGGGLPSDRPGLERGRGLGLDPNKSLGYEKIASMPRAQATFYLQDEKKEIGEGKVEGGGEDDKHEDDSTKLALAGTTTKIH